MDYLVTNTKKGTLISSGEDHVFRLRLPIFDISNIGHFSFVAFHRDSFHLKGYI
jgi:hypothetical protein